MWKLVVPGSAGLAILARGVEERVIRLLKTRNAAGARSGQAEGGDRADNGHPADYGRSPEYPARAHSHGPGDVNPAQQSAPAVPPGRTNSALDARRLQQHHAVRPGIRGHREAPATRSFLSRHHIAASRPRPGTPASSAGVDAPL